MSQLITKWIAALCFAALLLHWQASPVQAQTIFADNFSGDLSKWEVVQADPNFWQTNNGILISNITSYFTQAIMVPNADHWPENVAGYKVSFDMLPVRGDDKNIIFAYETPNDWYDLHFNRQGSELLKVTDGSMVWKEKSGLRLQNGVWHHFELMLSNGQITITKDGETLFNLADPAYEGSYYRPGLRVTTGAAAPTEIYFDNFVVTEVENHSLSLPVPLLKQTDPTWNAEEYDTAAEWSDNPDIATWGCALTSAAMVLQYHGFATLPDGSALNPSSLNQWLLNQPDGYIGNGLVNWLAVTRLSYLLAQQHDQYALEYRKHPPDKTAVRQQLEQNQPPILQIPGYFVVGSGITTTGGLTIADPAYSFTQLSQHQQANRPLLSFRSFTPSYTDLSHLLIVHQPEINLEITHNDQPANSFTTQEYLAGFGLTATPTTDTVLLTELAQPQANNYTLSITSAEPTPTQLKLYLYSQDGSVESEVISLTANPYPTKYSLELNNETAEPPTITRNYSFAQLDHDLQQMVLNGDLSYWWIYFQFQQIINYAATANSADQLRYLTLLNNMLATHQHLFTNDAQQYLQANLEILESSLK